MTYSQGIYSWDFIRLSYVPLYGKNDPPRRHNEDTKGIVSVLGRLVARDRTPIHPNTS